MNMVLFALKPLTKRETGEENRIGEVSKYLERNESKLPIFDNINSSIMVI